MPSNEQWSTSFLSVAVHCLRIDSIIFLWKKIQFIPIIRMTIEAFAYLCFFLYRWQGFSSYEDFLTASAIILWRRWVSHTTKRPRGAKNWKIVWKTPKKVTNVKKNPHSKKSFMKIAYIELQIFTLPPQKVVCDCLFFVQWYSRRHYIRNYWCYQKRAYHRLNHFLFPLNEHVALFFSLVRDARHQPPFIRKSVGPIDLASSIANNREFIEWRIICFPGLCPNYIENVVRKNLPFLFPSSRLVCSQCHCHNQLVNVFQPQ